MTFHPFSKLSVPHLRASEDKSRDWNFLWNDAVFNYIKCAYNSQTGPQTMPGDNYAQFLVSVLVYQALDYGRKLNSCACFHEWGIWIVRCIYGKPTSHDPSLILFIIFIFTTQQRLGRLWISSQHVDPLVVSDCATPCHVDFSAAKGFADRVCRNDVVVGAVLEKYFAEQRGLAVAASTAVLGVLVAVEGVVSDLAEVAAAEEELPEFEV
ncbi:hypothetical protein F8388_021153 [Cannabis sativa]|uniref:Uncharacterized protein n=1 Tax=Cannabis sativa TaxID=3483 RepID=A0A7J6GEZ1_CANSA|nr:hypothetical protein F8388_021153 [Cannabis sativa]